MRNRSIFNLLVLCITAFILSSFTGNRALADQTVQPVGFACVVYASNEESSKDSQLLTINLRTNEVARLGQVHKDYNLEGLAVNPASQTLYAISGQSSPFAGNLYTVDFVTGDLILVGDTGFKKLSGLTLQPVNGTLWSWEKGTGLIQIDPTTAASTLQFSSPKFIEDITWSPDGSVLYAIQGKSLYIYTPQNGTFERAATNLPSRSSAAEIRPDGLLLVSQNKDDTVHIFAYDPTSSQSVMDAKIRSRYDNVEAIAWPSACGNASPGGEADFIQSVTIDKSQICSGESVLVSVVAEHPESPKDTVDVSINGDWGASRYLQFTGEPGIRLIQVTATTPEKYIDLWQGEVEVVACDATQIFPILVSRPNPFHDLTVDLDILNANEFNTQSPTYLWEFGDGLTEQTTVPFIAHDFSNATDVNQLYTAFQAKVTVQRAGQPDVSTYKTLTVWNQYAFNKRRGMIQPRIESDERMNIVGQSFVGTYRIRNLEDEPIQFTSRQFEFQFCDPDQVSTPLPAEAFQLSLDSQQELTPQIEIPLSSVTPDVCGVAVQLVGQTASQVNAYASLYFDIQDNRLMNQAITDPAMLGLLNDIVAKGLVPDPFHITDEDLYRLQRAGEISVPPLTSSVSSDPLQSPLAAENAVTVMKQAGTDVIGQPCRPDDTPPRPGVSCQITGAWTIAPPHIANARKGDIILSSKCGVIGDLLRNVSPPQRFSHSGIMTRNYYELRNSTADGERPKDYLLGFKGGQGIRFDILKYGWPGTITQSIDEAYNGEFMPDPESGKRYEIQSFSGYKARCGEDISITYPLVVKPPPGHDPSIRTRLEEAAEAAKGINAHYRFFGYTNAAISEDGNFNAPAGIGWADGTQATMCSSFVWTALRQAGIQLEGPVLETADYMAGGERDLETLDGLYFYTEAERKGAADWLYTDTYNQAYEKAGWFGNLITGAADDFGNQLTNCFASDWCGTEPGVKFGGEPDAKDSDRWKNPGVGRSVSPDNFLLWDAPETGGAYGYNEKLVYRDGAYIPETQWMASEGVGTITGLVVLNGVPVENASVTILGLELFSDANGQFQDDLIPAGTYNIEASKDIDGRFYSGTAMITVAAGGTTQITLELQPPPSYFREVNVNGNMFIVDYETVESNETKNIPIFQSKFVNPFSRDESMQFKGCAGNEVRVELDFSIHLEDDQTTVTVWGEARLYEDDGFGFWDPPKCSDGDHKVTQTFSLTIPADGAEMLSLRLYDDGDRGDIDVTITNFGQQ